jgi:colicin import membrane protein
MFEFARENPAPLLAALLLHGLLASLFFVALPFAHEVRPAALPAIDSFAVDPDALLRPARERAAAQRRQRELEAAERRRQQETAERQVREQRAEEARQAEVQRREEQVKLEREQAAAEQKRREEAERQRKEALERQRREEAERKKKEAAEQQRRELEAREQAGREAELRQQLAEEEARQRAADSGLLNQYVAMIEQRIIRNWNRPATALPGLRCEVAVAQAPGGTVLSVIIGTCNGDAIVRQSIEAAVLRSSPLPPPPDPRLFERNLKLIFEPRD